MKDVFKVTFVSESNCFFYLNQKNLAKYEKDGKLNGTCIKIEFGANFDNYAYSSISSRPINIADDRIGLSALNSECLGLKENDEVLISVVNAPLLAEVYVRPQTDNHYQLLVKNSSFLETNLLNQVKVVTLGKTIPIRVFSNIVINLKVEKLNPNSPYGQLQQRTNMVVVDPCEVAEYGSSNSQNKGGSLSSTTDLSKIPFVNFFAKLLQKNDLIMKKSSNYQKSKENGADNELEKTLSKFCVGNKFANFRIAPLFFAPKEIQQIIGKNCVFASGFPKPIRVDGSCCFKMLCKITKEENKESNYSHFRNVSQTFSYVICFSDFAYPSNDILYVPDFVMNLLDVEYGSPVHVEQVNAKENLTRVIRHVGLESSEYFFSESVESILPEKMHEIYQNVKQTVVDNIRHNQKINSLIIGGTGTGKTYLISLLSDYFSKKNLKVHGIDCKSMRKSKISNLEKTLNENFAKCRMDKPSVMLLDNLDCLLLEEEEENSYGSLYSNRAGTLIIDLVSSYQSFNEIFFIATGRSLALFKHMSTDRGPIIFENIHEISELTLSERAFFLKRLSNVLIPRIVINESLFESVANRSKGYNVQDLVDLIKIAEFNALSRENSNAEEISADDFDYALSEKVPLSLHGIKLQKRALTRWEDIGGMEESKNLLKEMFDWPVRYQEVYSSCPLRLQCGILLYGAPGTGKTLIASAVANEFGLNFISIKGPEVFSKYVGASEQGIRDLFDRAKSAKPCLLFFDEFESLARRRGSSNEQVNDRVVNQLLTELDGVEELSGVFILAATSRPELLDPALLRPGRIDKVLHCKLPNEAERLSILKVLSKNVSLSDDVRLEEISAKTDGYSGADLRAILYRALSSLIKEVGKGDDGNSPGELTLKQSHLLIGLTDTKPSISKLDRQNYDASYEGFIAARSGRSLQQNQKIQQVIMFA